HPNVMAVGDDSQSIYSFRGATFRNIMDFPKTFPDTRIVKLEDNYRSTQPILDLANAIIDRAAEKHTKVLRTRRAEGPPPLLVQRGDVPFVKRGGFKFIETAHVKDVLAHLRVVANPRDAVSWHRVLLLLEHVGPKTAT